MAVAAMTRSKSGGCPRRRSLAASVPKRAAAFSVKGMTVTTFRKSSSMGRAASGSIVLAHNTVDGVDLPRKARREIHVWDSEQVRLFLAEAKRSSPYYRLYLAAITTGCVRENSSGCDGRTWISWLGWPRSSRHSIVEPITPHGGTRTHPRKGTALHAG